MNRKAQVQAALSRTPSPTRQENIKFLKPGPVAPPSDPAPAEEPLGRPKLDRSDKFYHPNDQKRGHMLMTEEVAATLPPLYSTENDEDPVARVKFFSSAGTWLVTEMDPDTGPPARRARPLLGRAPALGRPKGEPATATQPGKAVRSGGMAGVHYRRGRGNYARNGGCSKGFYEGRH